MSRKELIPFVLVLLIPNKTALISKIYFKNTPIKALFSLGVFLKTTFVTKKHPV